MNDNEILSKFDLVDMDKDLNNLTYWRIVLISNPDKFINTIIHTRTYIDIDNYEFYIDHKDQVRVKFGGNIYKTGVFLNQIKKLKGDENE